VFVGVKQGRGAEALALSARVFVICVLAASSAWLLTFVYQFSLTRFFTIDEYQWGHATWLVSEGKVPYRDFYEHHLPLGYLLHSVFLSNGESFAERALLLRKIAFAYILIAAAFLAITAYVVRRDPFQSLLSIILPISLGFGLMSAIDYRGDNWAAFSLLCCFAVLEMNQSTRRAWLAALAGLLFSVAILMTQKTLVLGGFVVVLMLLPSFWQQLSARPPAWLLRFGTWQIYSPTIFCVAAALPLAVLVALGGWVGQLDRAFQIIFVQSLQHEQFYPSFSGWKYLGPYLRHVPWTAGALAACAVFHLVAGHKRFWALPTAAVLVGGMRITAPFPYNFVLASLLVGICAARGYCDAVRRLGQRWPVLMRPLPFLYLLPLLVALAQVGFVQGSTSNLNQLETLRRIEAYSTPEDVVIDSEGSALFRPHRSYYWYQGPAQIKMFDDYYRGDFVLDLRASEALFWINGFRSRQLPAAARQYLLEHYIPYYGDLFVLGFAFPANTSDRGVERAFDVVRSGTYYVSLQPQGSGQSQGAPPAAAGHELRIDGRAVPENSVYLEAARHLSSVAVGAPGYRLSYLPPAAFDQTTEIGRHAPLFEYDRPR
jgi:hypothetical protein